MQLYRRATAPPTIVIATTGRKIEIEIDGEDRQVILAVGNIEVTEPEEATIYLIHFNFEKI